jgi:hypothetical protein
LSQPGPEQAQLIGGVPLPHATVQSERSVHVPVQPELHVPSTVADDDATNAQLPPAQLTSQHTLSLQSNMQPPPSQLSVQLDCPLQAMLQLPLGHVRVQSFPHVQLAALPAVVSQTPSNVASSVRPSPGIGPSLATNASCGPSSPPTFGAWPSKPIRPHAATAITRTMRRTSRPYPKTRKATLRSTARSMRV